MANWFNGIWRSITQQDLVDSLNETISQQGVKITYLNTVVHNAGKEKSDLAEKVANLETDKFELTSQLTLAQESVEKLKFELANADLEVPVDQPAFIDETIKPYQPRFGVPGSDETWGGSWTDLYVPTDLDKKDASRMRGKTKVEKLKQLWNEVVKGIKYAYDGPENWQTPYVTRWRTRGDCEDGSIWIVAKARANGIPADQIFNAVGNTAFGYHSFPVVYLTEAEAIEWGTKTKKAGWYIMESTLDFMPSSPDALKSSQYWVDGGLANWRFFGKVRPANISEFNGAYTGSALQEREIDNSLLKRQKIIEYWKKKELV